MGKLHQAEPPDPKVDLGQPGDAVSIAHQQGLADPGVVSFSANALLVEAHVILVLRKARGHVAVVFGQRREAVAVRVEDNRHCFTPFRG